MASIWQLRGHHEHGKDAFIMDELYRRKYVSAEIPLLILMTSREKRESIFNRFQNTRTSQKELEIVCWILLHILAIAS